ncbi:MAG: Trk family potassium uptake protein [Lachnospiraceae bacterium]|nr:Trk family potassium uptake protein [Lachnospiraceae bacterium]
MNRFIRRLSQTRIIALGFFFIIAIGTFLLTLPFATKAGQVTTFTDALFTSVSATCVTGLVLVDTWIHWTVFGQIIILIMIQIGGLGFITIAVMFSVFLRKRVGLQMRGILQESVNAQKLGGIIRLLKKVFIGTLAIEGIGAIILAIRFSVDMGPKWGIYYGIWHSISAFCNAGFDLFGIQGEYSSLVNYVGDPVINITIMLLIILGGIGFIVWDDISKNKFNFRKYMLHTKIVLSATTVLIFGGALLFYIFEKDNLLADCTVAEKIFGSLFGSVTARTAGFNTLDVAQYNESTKLLTSVLMFIGGSPGSTAGGVKTVTIMVIVTYLWSSLRNAKSCNIFSRSISDKDVKKASNIIVIHMGVAVIACMALCHMNDCSLADIVLEVFSAVGTVGMSTGITREINLASQYILIALMFSGRLGSMSFASTFTDRKKVPPVQLPKEKIIIG